MQVRAAWRYLLLSIAIPLIFMPTSAFAVRLKDMSYIKGVRPNQLIGYGLVVGLAGTGDGTTSTFTIQSLVSLLSGMGITIDPAQLWIKNVAAVMVTARLPAFARIGAKIDVVVSSTGDARSLLGGTLLLSPLRAANGEVYAVAQGPLTIGGYNVRAYGNSKVKNHTTVGRIPGGALVEREVPFELNGREHLELVLRNPDFTNSVMIEGAINERMAAPVATARDSGTIDLEVPVLFRERVPEMIALLEDIEVLVDRVAKVVLNERTGTVVMGDQVRISKVAVAHGNLTIQIETTPLISQPAPFARTGTTVLTGDTEVAATEGDQPGESEKRELQVVEGATIGDVVGALNALGVSPRDIITILQAIRVAGALQAEIELM